MPGFNGRGPLNEGPMTGRRLGRCTANDATDYRPGFGAGFHGGGYGRGIRGSHWNGGGNGWGRGYGYRANFYHHGAGPGAHWNNPDYSAPEEGLQDTSGQSELNRQLTRVLDQLAELLRRTPGSREGDNETK